MTPWLRARVAVGKRLVSWAVERSWLRSRLAARRPVSVDGRTLDPASAVLLGLDDLQPGSDVRKQSPRQLRARLAEQAAICDALPPPGVRVEDRKVPGPAGPLALRLYAPEGLDTPAPAIVYLHGGGWCSCSVDTHDALCRRLAVGARCRVVAPEYRMAPEHRFPAAVEDAVAAVRWVLANAEALGLDPARVGVAGDSAGGNLSAVVSLRTREDVRRPALQVLLYPVTDATFSHASHETFREGYFLTRAMIDWYLGHYTGGAVDARDPDLSPLHASDVRGAPPARVYTAGFDPLRDEGRAYAERLRDAGVPVTYREFPSLLHGFLQMTGVSEAAREAADALMADVGRALREVPGEEPRAGGLASAR